MNKQYISILDLLPTLIETERSDREIGDNLFPSNDRLTTQYYYEVEEADTSDKKKLHFKDLSDMIVEASIDIASRSGYRMYTDLTNDNYSKKPYILTRQYEVPHIIELEYIKLSPYGSILSEEHIDYVENILYQYLLYYDSLVSFEENDSYHDMDHYYNTGEDSELYQTIDKFIFEKDTKDDDFEDFVNKTVHDKYEKLSKIKRPTKKVLAEMPLRMYACRNLEELLEIANKGRSRFYNDIDDLRSVEGMSNAIPLLIIYSAIEQTAKSTLLPSYRIYHDIFYQYPENAKGEMKEDYTLEEYMDEYSSYNYIDDVREDEPFFYRYGCHVEMNNRYVANQDDRMNMFLFPHIMNQIRIAYFHNSNKMVVPQEIMREFRSEPWSDLVQAETILSQRYLNWSDDEC